MQVKMESSPTRCEICHKSDYFHPKTNYCSRCARMLTSVSAKSTKEDSVFKQIRLLITETAISGICGAVILPSVFLIKHYKISFYSESINQMLFLVVLGAYAGLIGNAFSRFWTAQHKENSWRFIAWSAMLVFYLGISFFCLLVLENLPTPSLTPTLIINPISVTVVLAAINLIFSPLMPHLKRWTIFGMYVGTVFNPIYWLLVAIPGRCGSSRDACILVSSITGVVWGTIIGVLVVLVINFCQKRLAARYRRSQSFV